MIDYEKLKQAIKITSELSYGKLKCEFSKHDGCEFFFNYCNPDGVDGYLFTNLDDLITKLKELTKSEPKYAVDDFVWRLNDEHGVTKCRVISLDLASDEMYLCEDDDFGENWWTESQLYPTREALIEAQIKHWQSMLGPFDTSSLCAPNDYAVKEPEECEHKPSMYGHRQLGSTPDTEHEKCELCEEFYR